MTSAKLTLAICLWDKIPYLAFIQRKLAKHIKLSTCVQFTKVLGHYLRFFSGLTLDLVSAPNSPDNRSGLVSGGLLNHWTDFQDTFPVRKDNFLVVLQRKKETFTSQCSFELSLQYPQQPRGFLCWYLNLSLTVPTLRGLILWFSVKWKWIRNTYVKQTWSSSPRTPSLFVFTVPSHPNAHNQRCERAGIHGTACRPTALCVTETIRLFSEIDSVKVKFTLDANKMPLANFLTNWVLLFPLILTCNNSSHQICRNAYSCSLIEMQTNWILCMFN